MSSVKNSPRPTTTPNATPTVGASGPPTPPALDDAEALPIGEAGATDITRASAPQRAPRDVVDAAIATARRAQMPMFVTPDGANAAVLGLLRLPNADLKDAVVGLAGANGEKFGQLLAAVDDSTRDVLVRRLEHGGVFSSTSALTTPVPPRAPTPPPGPSLVKFDPALPEPLRDLALQHNLAATRAYVEAYDVYREQYGAAVDGAKSVSSLRALGPGAGPALPSNLPAVGSRIEDSRANAAYRKARGDTVSDVDMSTRVADKLRTLTGRPVAGVSFTLEGKAMVTLSGVSGYGATVGITRNADGSVDGKAAAHLSILGQEGSIDTDGTLSAEGHVGDFGYKVDEDGVDVETSSTGPDGNTSSGMVTVGKHHVGLGAMGSSVTVDNGKGLELEGDFGAMSGKAGFNGDNVSASMKVGHEFGTDDTTLELELEAGFVAQGVTRADRDAFVSTSDVGFYDTPPELQRGKGWSSLPAAVKGDYVAQGWSEQEWADAAALTKTLLTLR